MKKIVKKVNNKAIISGKTIEFYDYEIGYYVGYARKKNKSFEENENLAEEEKAYIREKKKVNKELIEKITKQSNFKMSQDEIEQNKLKNNIKANNRAKTKVNYDFNKFIKRLKYRYKHFDYIAVIEKQQRGSLHYHVVFFGLPYIKKAELQEIWNKGSVKINAIEKFDRLGQYLVKYMTKDVATGRDEEQKRYLASRGLRKPVELYNVDIDEMIEDEQLRLVFKKKFESEYIGKGSYLYCAIM